MKKIAMLFSVLAASFVLSSCSSCCGQAPCCNPAPCCAPTPCCAPAPCCHHDYKCETCCR